MCVAETPAETQDRARSFVHWMHYTPNTSDLANDSARLQTTHEHDRLEAGWTQVIFEYEYGRCKSVTARGLL